MATKTLSTRIVMRNDTAENWTTKNPVLLKGEFGVETDTNKFKLVMATRRGQILIMLALMRPQSKILLRRIGTVFISILVLMLLSLMMQQLLQL